MKGKGLEPGDKVLAKWIGSTLIHVLRMQAERGLLMLDGKRPRRCHGFRSNVADLLEFRFDLLPKTAAVPTPLHLTHQIWVVETGRSVKCH